MARSYVEVIPLASSRDTRNGPDWKDVARAFLDFQEQLGKGISVVLTVSGSQLSPQLHLIAVASDGDRVLGAVGRCYSASVSMPSTGVGDLNAALLCLGYELDREAYRRGQGMPPNTA